MLKPGVDITESMTPRERVQAALNHKQPDHVPVDFGATPVSGIAVSTVYRLRQKLGIDGPEDRVRVIEPYQMLGEIRENLRVWLHADIVPVTVKGTRFGFGLDDWKPWETFDGAKVEVPGLFNTEPDENGDILQYPGGGRAGEPSARMPKDGFYFDAIIRQHPIDDDNLDPDDNVREDFTEIPDEVVREQERFVKYAYDNTAYALSYVMPGTSLGNVAAVPGTWIKDPKGIRDIEEWYVSHLTRRDYINEVYSRQTDIALNNMKKLVEAFGDRIDVFYLTGTDFGSQRGPLMSPDTFRDLFLPHYKRMTDFIHKHTSWKVFMHSCGGIRPLIEDIIEAGIDILNPVQTSAEGMDAAELKAEYGGRLVFHGGGVDTQRTLPHGRPEDVYDEVIERIRILNQGGGYIFNTIHNIQADAPVENIEAMIKAIEDSF